MRELVYYVAVSLDGFIAGPDGQYDAFPLEGDHIDAISARFADTVPTDAAAALGLAQDRSKFDTVLMGWNTYRVGGMSSPYRHLRQIVFSRAHTAEGENLLVTDHDPVETVRRLKAESGSGIWLCGGGQLAGVLASEIDRLVIKRYPLLLGAGIPMFDSRAYLPSLLREVETTVFQSGVVFSEYERRIGG